MQDKARDRVFAEAVTDAAEAAAAESGSLMTVARASADRVVGLMQAYLDTPMMRGDADAATSGTSNTVDPVLRAQASMYFDVLQGLDDDTRRSAKLAGVDAGCRVFALDEYVLRRVACVVWELDPREVLTACR